MELNPDIVRRLNLIKHYYEFAREQSKLPSPHNFFSILMFHDSVELFLHLSAEHLHANIDGIGFMTYFKRIDEELKKLGKGKLAQKSSIDTLNKERVLLKHHEVYPNPDNLEKSRVNTQNFFEENTLIVFGINFKDINLIDLIYDNEVKKYLESSKKYSKERDLKRALEQIAISFNILIGDYKSDEKRFGSDPFLSKSFIFHMFSQYGEINSNSSGISSFNREIEEIRDLLKVLFLKIDTRKYLKFKFLTPFVLENNTTSWFRYNQPPKTIEQVEYCFNFVIETALNIQEFDSEIKEIS